MPAKLLRKDGASASAEAKTGPAKFEIRVDKNGVHSGATAAKDKDVKIGGTVHGPVGVGASINMSQAGRAWNNAVASANALGQFLEDKFMPNGMPF